MRFDLQSSHRVYVSPRFWFLDCDVQQKEWYAHAFAIYSEHRYASGYWIDIFDNQSGRKLAQFHAIGGFAIEDE